VKKGFKMAAGLSRLPGRVTPHTLRDTESRTAAFQSRNRPAKGGVAFVGNSYSFSDPCSTGACGASTLALGHNATQTTYAVGAGIEYALINNWSIKGEYLYLGTRQTFTQSGIAAGGLAGTTETNTASDPGIHTAKIGLNYRWGGPIVAKY
jgi:outer membrane immunogenic protein